MSLNFCTVILAMGEDSLILPINNHVNNCNNTLTVNKKIDSKKLNNITTNILLIIKRKFKLFNLVIFIIIISVLIFGLILPKLYVKKIMQHKVNSSFSDSVLEDFTEGYSHQVLDDYHDLDDLDKIKKSIVEALGLKMIPDPSKVHFFLHLFIYYIKFILKLVF